MDKPNYDQGIGLRTTPDSRKALVRVVAALKNSDRVKFFGKQATQEAIINASWLWLDAMDEATLESAMAEFVPRLEALMRGEAVPPIERDRTKKAATSPMTDDGPKRRRKSS